MKKATILGEGAWGTAIATLLSASGIEVKLWCYDPAVANTIKTTRINERYAPDVVLSELIQPTSDLEEAVCSSPWVLEAIPVKYLRGVLERTRACFKREQVWGILSKGLEADTLMLPSQIIDDVFDYEPRKVIIAGPSFAHDLMQQQITAVTVAATECEIGVQMQQLLATDFFKPYLSLDLIGVQVGGALKNVMALGIGMLEGSGATDNTKTFLFTRGLRELVHLAEHLGGKAETVYGLSGLGDLVLTCMGKLSRNLAVGRLLGQGASLEKVLEETGYIPEGVNSVQSMYQLMQKRELNLPICRGIYQAVFEQKNIDDLMTDLMRQPLEQECA